MSADTLTVLRSVSGKHAAKRYRRRKDGTIANRSYDKEMFFSVEAIPVNDIYALADALERLAASPSAFVIRGEPLPGIDHKHALRRALPDKKTGEPATFAEKPRYWFLSMSTIYRCQPQPIPEPSPRTPLSMSSASCRRSCTTPRAGGSGHRASRYSPTRIIHCPCICGSGAWTRSMTQSSHAGPWRSTPAPASS